MLFKHLALDFLIVYIIHTYFQNSFQDTKIKINFSIILSELRTNHNRKKI
jgi:hypothetical protein